jgi:hypothetical protein
LLSRERRTVTDTSNAEDQYFRVEQQAGAKSSSDPLSQARERFAPDRRLSERPVETQTIGSHYRTLVTPRWGAGIGLKRSRIVVLPVQIFLSFPGPTVTLGATRFS